VDQYLRCLLPRCTYCRYRNVPFTHRLCSRIPRWTQFRCRTLHCRWTILRQTFCVCCTVELCCAAFCSLPRICRFSALVLYHCSALSTLRRRVRTFSSPSAVTMLPLRVAVPLHTVRWTVLLGSTRSLLHFSTPPLLPTTVLFLPVPSRTTHHHLPAVANIHTILPFLPLVISCLVGCLFLPTGWYVVGGYRVLVLVVVLFAADTFTLDEPPRSSVIPATVGRRFPALPSRLPSCCSAVCHPLQLPDYHAPPLPVCWFVPFFLPHGYYVTLPATSLPCLPCHGDAVNCTPRHVISIAVASTVLLHCSGRCALP